MRSESQIKQALGIWNYPYDALEAVVNALYHRDYRQYEPVEDLKSRVRIRKMMKAEPTITLKGIAELLGVTSRTIERTVAQMINDGDIIHEGPKKGGTWKVLK